MPSSSDQTSQLIAAARRADRQSLATLLEQFRNYLRLLARTGIDTTLRGKADPSDLVQETMLKASLHFDGFRGTSEAELAAWLRQILAQCLIHHARHYCASTRRADRERSLTDLLDRSSMQLSALAAARVSSFGSSGFPTDVTAALDSSWGEIGFHTRVSSFQEFITTATSGQAVFVPEPATWVLIAVAIVVISLREMKHASSRGAKGLREASSACKVAFNQSSLDRSVPREARAAAAQASPRSR